MEDAKTVKVGEGEIRVEVPGIWEVGRSAGRMGEMEVG